MSVVVFPFKEEDHEVVIQNVTRAAGHPRVTNVVCMGLDEASTYGAIKAAIPAVEDSTGTPVTLLLQDRIGSLRPGKGDAMNTSLRYFLEQSTEERLHFYDADITSFRRRMDRAGRSRRRRRFRRGSPLLPPFEHRRHDHLDDHQNRVCHAVARI